LADYLLFLADSSGLVLRFDISRECRMRSLRSFSVRQSGKKQWKENVFRWAMQVVHGGSFANFNGAE
jgi:hypothetical protein